MGKAERAHRFTGWKGERLRALLTTAAVLILLFVLASARQGLALAIPAYKGYVNDYADMISPAMEARLEQALADFDRTDSTQVAILTIPSLEGDPLEDFSIRVVDSWKVGQKNKDNGVLLLAVKQIGRAHV